MSFCIADELRALPLIRERRRILQDEHGALHRLEAFRTRLKVTAQDVLLVDTIVRQESVSGLGRGPILTCEGNRLADARPQPLQYHAKAFAESGILKFACLDLLLEPSSLV